MSTKNKALSFENPTILMLLYLLCVFCGIMYFVTSMSVIGWFAVILICYVTLITPEEDCFLMIAGLQFIRVIISFDIGSSSLGFIFFVYLVLAIKILIKNEGIFIEYGIIIIILIIDVITSMLSGVSKIATTVNWTFSLLYMIMILRKYAHKIKFERLLNYYLIAQWAICIVNIIAELKIFGQTLIPGMYGTWTEIGYFAFGWAYKPIAGGNSISFNNALAIAFCLMMLPKVKKTYVKIFYLLSIAFLGYCGVLVIGRGFYAELLIFAVLIFLCVLKKPAHMMGGIAIMCVIAAAVVVLLNSELAINIERVLSRFDQGNEDRDLLIQQSFELLATKFNVFAFGGGSSYPDVYGFTAHNIYLDSILSVGFLAAIAYWVMIIYNIALCIKKNCKISLKAMIPLIMLFVYKFVSGSTRDVEFYYNIAICVIFAIYMSPKEVKRCQVNP